MTHRNAMRGRSDMITQIGVDIDGVLGDFMKHACDFHGIPYTPELYPPGVYDTSKLINCAGDCKVTQQQFWDKFDYDFWLSMPWTVDGREILEMAFRKVGRQNVFLSTSPSENPMCAAGKMAWIQKEIPELRRRFLIGSAKYFTANPQSALIDDFDKNIGEYIARGGIGITLPRIWNSQHANRDHVRSYLLNRLTEI